MKQTEFLKRIANALEHIADALEANNQTDQMGMELAENFKDMIEDVISRQALGPDQEQVERQILSDEEKMFYDPDLEPPTVGHVVAEPTGKVLTCPNCESEDVMTHGPHREVSAPEYPSGSYHIHCMECHGIWKVK